MTHWQVSEEEKSEQKVCSFNAGEKQAHSLFNHMEGNVQKHVHITPRT